MAGNHLFYYFGDDEAFFKTLQGEFRRSTRLPIEFKRIFRHAENEIQTLFLSVYQDRPTVVFIDFSKHTQDYLHLARIIVRTPFDHNVVTVGLVDYLSTPQVIAESIATGVNLTHIKSPETFGVVFGVGKLIAPQEIGEHGFATAVLKEEWEAGIPAKIGYVNETGLHFETDFNVKKGDRLLVQHAWMKNKIVPSRQTFVKETATTNLFYHFKQSVDVDFIFIDEFIAPEGMEEDRIKDRLGDREHAINQHKKLLKSWVEENQERSLQKKAKVLIVDSTFAFYQGQARTDKHAYTIRCIPYFKDIAEELEKLQPQVIAFNLDEGEKEPRNTPEQLNQMAQILKSKLPELNPFIVVFNCATSSKQVQDDLNYNNVMATSNPISVEIMARMAEVYDKKMNAAFVSPKDKRVYIRKTNPDSLCEIIIPITVLKLSETDMIFTTEIELATGTNLHIKQPVDMFINVQPIKAQGKQPEYLGLIHCLGEVDQKELRRFVNSVFFREHDAQLQAETDEFKKLNEIKLNERIELDKKLKEDAEKAKAEAEKEKADKLKPNRPEAELEKSETTSTAEIPPKNETEA
jgi:hypothetical protein